MGEKPNKDYQLKTKKILMMKKKKEMNGKFFMTKIDSRNKNH